jgi:hypothetical protein
MIMGVTVSFDEARKRNEQRATFTRESGQLDAIQRLAKIAHRLEKELRAVFGVEIKTSIEDDKVYQDHFAKCPDNLVIYSRTSDMTFPLSASKLMTREAAIAKLYHRMTQELLPGQTIRKYNTDGTFVAYGYSKTQGAFYKIDPNAVVVRCAPVAAVA